LERTVQGDDSLHKRTVSQANETWSVRQVAGNNREHRMPYSSHSPELVRPPELQGNRAYKRRRADETPQLCRYYWSNGYCGKAERCEFVHCRPSQDEREIQ